MIFEIIAFIALTIATITDLKKREVPDTLSYGLIGFAAVSRIILSVKEGSFTPLIEGISGFAIFFGIGFVLYKLNQWGGGDTKLIGGLGALFGISFSNLFMLDFFINMLLFGALYGVFFGIYIALKNRDKIKYGRIKYMKQISIIFVLVFIAGEFLFHDISIKLMYAVLILLIYSSIFIINFTSAIQKYGLQRYVVPDVLTEGDWIGEDVKVDGKLICRKKDNGLTLEQISRLKKLFARKKIKKVLLKEGIPFVPGFLIAFIVTIMGGNAVLLILNILV